MFSILVYMTYCVSHIFAGPKIDYFTLPQIAKFTATVNSSLNYVFKMILLGKNWDINKHLTIYIHVSISCIDTKKWIKINCGLMSLK